MATSPCRTEPHDQPLWRVNALPRRAAPCLASDPPLPPLPLARRKAASHHRRAAESVLRLRIHRAPDHLPHLGARPPRLLALECHAGGRSLLSATAATEPRGASHSELQISHRISIQELVLQRKPPPVEPKCRNISKNISEHGSSEDSLSRGKSQRRVQGVVQLAAIHEAAHASVGPAVTPGWGARPRRPHSLNRSSRRWSSSVSSSLTRAQTVHPLRDSAESVETRRDAAVESDRCPRASARRRTRRARTHNGVGARAEAELAD
jgi:hypothetical protein